MALSIEERGVYITAISAIYSAQKSIKICHLRALCPMHGNSFNSILLRLVQSGKLSRKGDEIHSKRCRNEIEKALKRVRNAVENGKKGGRPQTKSNGYDTEEVSDPLKLPRARLSSPSPPPLKEKKEEPPPLSPPVPVGKFDRFWLYYPNKVGKRAAQAAFRRASARAPPAVIDAGLQRYLVEKPDDRPWCNPSTWLNQDRWLDQPDETPRSNGSGRNQQLSPSEALFLGAARAADAVERRDREAAARACCPDCPPAKPFLDRC
jgi:hypothetical protein